MEINMEPAAVCGPGFFNSSNCIAAATEVREANTMSVTEGEPEEDAESGDDGVKHQVGRVREAST